MKTEFSTIVKQWLSDGATLDEINELKQIINFMTATENIDKLALEVYGNTSSNLRAIKFVNDKTNIGLAGAKKYWEQLKQKLENRISKVYNTRGYDTEFVINHIISETGWSRNFSISYLYNQIVPNHSTPFVR